MAGRPGFGGDGEDVLPVQVRRFRGREVHGHDHEVAGQSGQRRRVRGSAEVELDAARHVVEVGRALA